MEDNDTKSVGGQYTAGYVRVLKDDECGISLLVCINSLLIFGLLVKFRKLRRLKLPWIAPKSGCGQEYLSIHRCMQ